MKKAMVLMAAVVLMGAAQAAAIRWSATISEEAPDLQLFVSMIAIDTTTHEELTLPLFSNEGATGAEVVQLIETKLGDETSVYTSGPLYADLQTWGERSNLMFVMELYNAETVLARSVGVAVADMIAAGAIDLEETGLPATPFEFAYNTVAEMVPEPTSGMLVLIGAGLLGLRRRKS